MSWHEELPFSPWVFFFNSYNVRQQPSGVGYPHKLAYFYGRFKY